jgi:single-strand DNA-binding protein
MPGLPEVTAIGTLTADVELRYTASGIPVASFTIACNDRKYDQASKSWTDGDATFLRCTLWRQAAENAAESFVKGARLIVVGNLKQRSYETREGEKRTAMELDVTEVGPSVKWATVKVAKAERSGADSRPPANDDPWGSAPQAPARQGASGIVDEPPF